MPCNRCYFHGLLFLVLMVALSALGGEQKTFTALDIGHAVDATAAQFTEVKLTYREDAPNRDMDGKPLPDRTLREWTIAFSIPNGWWLRSIRTLAAEGWATEEAMSDKDFLAAFDGNVTTHLYLKPFKSDRFFCLYFQGTR